MKFKERLKRSFAHVEYKTPGRSISICWCSVSTEGLISGSETNKDSVIGKIILAIPEN